VHGDALDAGCDATPVTMLKTSAMANARAQCEHVLGMHDLRTEMPTNHIFFFHKLREQVPRDQNEFNLQQQN
jgi:hypothetical protein